MGKIKTKKKILALIPARGGSKSIRKKNLIKINNKSLIELSFEVAKNSKYVSKIICSTDDKKIINHCKRIGLETILRPKKYAKDEKYAKDNKLGFWTMKFDYPWVWRDKVRSNIIKE